MHRAHGLGFTSAELPKGRCPWQSVLAEATLFLEPQQSPEVHSTQENWKDRQEVPALLEGGFLQETSVVTYSHLRYGSGVLYPIIARILLLLLSSPLFQKQALWAHCRSP